MKNFVFIVSCFLMVVLAGCRAQRHTQTAATRVQSDEIGMEFHRLESFWNSIAENFRVHVEFFSPDELSNEFTSLWTANHATLQGTAPSSTKPADGLGLAPSWGGIGGLGAVKSIDIEAERTQSEQSLSQADSTAVSKTELDEARQTEKASEARQDNGTWAILAIVAAVTFIVALIIVLKK